jgi:hypothetical protein
MRRADVVAGGVVALIGVGALVMALNLAFFSKDGTPGPGFFPVLLSAALGVLGAALAVSSLRPAPVQVRAVGDVTDVETAPPPDDEDGQTSWARMRKPALVGLAFVVALPLLTVLGFVVAMIALMAVLFYGVERRRGIGPAVAAIVVPIALYELFVELLGIQLPVGVFGLGVLGI